MATVPKGRLSYLVLSLKVNLIRALQFTLVRLVSLVKGIKPLEFEPFESITVPSTKSNRQIRVHVYRNAAALKPNVGPVAVHLNWHGKSL
jgi:hypothetical protein